MTVMPRVSGVIWPARSATSATSLVSSACAKRLQPRTVRETWTGLPVELRPT